MGTNFQPTHKGSPWEKGAVETSFSALGTLFAQYVAGYVGNSVNNRGRHAEQAAVWSISDCRSCWTSGSSLGGRTVPMMGCVIR